MVAELHVKKMDAFVEENGLEFERKRFWFELEGGEQNRVPG